MIYKQNVMKYIDNAGLLMLCGCLNAHVRKATHAIFVVFSGKHINHPELY